MADRRADQPAVATVGLIGCGRIGSAFDEPPPATGGAWSHASAIAAAGMQLVAVSDTDPARAAACAEARHVEHAHDDPLELIATHRPTLLCITSPPGPVRAELLAASVEHGVRGVFCEKPIAKTPAEARQLLAAVPETLAVAVNHQRSWSAGLDTALQWVADGKIGSIRSVTGRYGKGIANNGTHMVDLIRHFVGWPTRVEVIRTLGDGWSETDPTVDLRMWFDGGETGYLLATDHRDYTVFELQITGDGGRVTFTDSGRAVQLETAGDDPVWAGYRGLGQPTIVDGGLGEAMPRALRNLLNVVQGEATTLGCSIADAVRTLESIDTALPEQPCTAPTQRTTDKRPAILGGEPLRIEPFAPRRTMGATERQAAVDVVESDQLSGFFGTPGKGFRGGRSVLEFERAWAQRYGFKHAVSVNSWTSGLQACAGAIGLGPGDEMICPPYTMSASAICAVHYGATPVFADILPGTWNLDPASVEARITPRTKAIMVVHLFGEPADMDALVDIANRHGLRLIEDAAQAPGVRYKGTPVGAIGDLGGFSLNYHKHIHAGEGGMIVTNDDELADRCALIRNHGENVYESLGITDATNVYGGNYRMTELQAAIGRAQLDRLPGRLEHRRQLADHLHSRLEGVECLTSRRPDADREHAYYVFPMTFDAASAGLSRKRFTDAVNAELPVHGQWENTGLAGGYVRPLYLDAYFQSGRISGGQRYERGLCPVAEKAHFETFLLSPLVREPLTTADLDDLVGAIEKVLAHAPQIADADDAADG